MKPVIRRITTALVIAGASAVLVGCGSHNNDSAQAPIITGPNGTIPGGGFPGGQGGCVPITQPIPFTGQGIYFSYANIVGGYIPNQQPVGQVVIGGAAQGGQFQRNAVDMIISMNIIPMQTQYQGQQYPYPGGVPTQYQNPQYSGIPGYQNYGQTPGLANATGVIQIKPDTQQQIMAQFGGGYGGQYPGQIPGQYPGQIPGQYPGQIPGQYPGTYGQGQIPCVSGVAFNLGNYNGILYGGFVWLYINGTQHGAYYPI